MWLTLMILVFSLSLSLSRRLEVQDGFLLHVSQHESESERCDEQTFLMRPKLLEKSIEKEHFNLTWGEDLIRPLHCASHFVVLLNASQVVCSDFDLIYTPHLQQYTCPINLTHCHQPLLLTLEIWLKNNTLIELNSTVVREKCERDEHRMTFRPTPASSIRRKSECSFGEWSEWTQCSISCGPTPGVQKRRRVSVECDSREEEEIRSCLTNVCPQDCTLSAWGSWSPCSQSCGTGSRVRVRSVVSEARFGGQRCPASTSSIMSTREKCLMNACPVDGQWSRWSRWSYCSSTCGQGVKSRRRECSEPRAEFGGAECEGEGIEKDTCLIKECDKVHGAWSTWSRWSVCSTTCGRGEVTRTRSCDAPTPQHGGQECSGLALQTRPCYRTTLCNGTEMSNNETLSEANSSSMLTNSTLPWSDSSTLSIKRLQALEERECIDKAPFIDGYLGPFMVTNDESKRDKMSRQIYYECYNGFVNDQRTNQRRIFFSCPRANVLNHQRPSCGPAVKCVGPVALLGSDYRVPRRDPEVNSQVFAFCSSNVVKGSCFPDGIVRFQGDCNQAMNSSSVHKRCHTRDDRVQLDLGDHGWVQWSADDVDEHVDEDVDDQDGVEAASLAQLVSIVSRLASNVKASRNSSGLIERLRIGRRSKLCSLTLQAKVGQAIRLGLEAKPEQDVRIRIEQRGWHESREVLVNKAQNVFQSLTNELRVDVQFLRDSSSRADVRFNYQVVWPSSNVD